MASLLKTLSRFGIGGGRLILVPFTDYQVATGDLRPEYEPVVFRHFMRIVAEKVARRVGAIAISTGDNLGQVASQTLYNLACIDAGASMPTLRPVVGYDKSEIVKLAQADWHLRRLNRGLQGLLLDREQAPEDEDERGGRPRGLAPIRLPRAWRRRPSRRRRR